MKPIHAVSIFTPHVPNKISKANFQKQKTENKRQLKQMVQTKWAARHEGPACPSAPSFIYFSLRHQSSPQGPQKQLPAAGKAPFPGRLGAFLEALLPLGSAKTQQPLRSRVISKGGETRVTWPFSPLGVYSGSLRHPVAQWRIAFAEGSESCCGSGVPPCTMCACGQRGAVWVQAPARPSPENSGIVRRRAFSLSRRARRSGRGFLGETRLENTGAAAPARELCGGREAAGRPARATQTRFAARGLEGGFVLFCFVTCLFMKGKKFALLCLFFNLI